MNFVFMVALHNFCIHYGLDYTVADGKILLSPRAAVRGRGVPR